MYISCSTPIATVYLVGFLMFYYYGIYTWLDFSCSTSIVSMPGKDISCSTPIETIPGWISPVLFLLYLCLVRTSPVLLLKLYLVGYLLFYSYVSMPGKAISCSTPIETIPGWISAVLFLLFCSRDCIKYPGSEITNISVYTGIPKHMYVILFTHKFIYILKIDYFTQFSERKYLKKVRSAQAYITTGKK